MIFLINLGYVTIITPPSPALPSPHTYMYPSQTFVSREKNRLETQLCFIAFVLCVLTHSIYYR